MRPAAIAGVILIILSIVALIRGGVFASDRAVLSVGELEVTASEQRSIPPWVAGVGLVAGVVLVGAGSRRKA